MKIQNLLIMLGASLLITVTTPSFSAEKDNKDIERVENMFKELSTVNINNEIQILDLQKDIGAIKSDNESFKAKIKEETTKTIDASTKLGSDNLNFVWITIAAILVFFMQAGFAFLESGATRSKNMVNVLMKNYMDMAVGGIAFASVGFALMLGANSTGYYGFSHFFLENMKSEDYIQFFFQMMFAATSATIVSGAIAERTKFSTYLIGSFIISALIYPIFGSWAWGSLFEGKGWLKEMGFIDFAGSTVVHSVGAWCALVAAIIVGPRLGRFGRDGRAFEIPGHNIGLSSLGAFILWFAWFGFNGGSTLIGDKSIGLVVTNTHLAGCAAAVAVMLYQYIKGEKILLTMVLNAGLAGLVAVTAGAATMTPWYAMLTGAIGGLLMYMLTKVLLAFGIDDVVGAFPVHGAGGIWGTLAAGIFYAPDMFSWDIIWVQLVGIFACAAWTIPTAAIMYYILKVIIGLRVPSNDERAGLDFTEHAEVGYPEFQKDILFNKDDK